MRLSLGVVFAAKFLEVGSAFMRRKQMDAALFTFPLIGWQVLVTTLKIGPPLALVVAEGFEKTTLFLSTHATKAVQTFPKVSFLLRRQTLDATYCGL